MSHKRKTKHPTCSCFQVYPNINNKAWQRVCKVKENVLREKYLCSWCAIMTEMCISIKVKGKKGDHVCKPLEILKVVLVKRLT